MSGALAQSIALINDWDKITLGGETAYRGEIVYTPFINIA